MKKKIHLKICRNNLRFTTSLAQISHQNTGIPDKFLVSTEISGKKSRGSGLLAAWRDLDSSKQMGEAGRILVMKRHFWRLEALNRLLRGLQVLPSLKLTFSPLKMDGWNTIVSSWVSAYFQGRAVSFREGTIWDLLKMRLVYFLYLLALSFLA